MLPHCPTFPLAYFAVLVWQVLEENKLKEIKNGRLAMLAFLGFVAQHAATGKVGPVAPYHCPLLMHSRPYGSCIAT